MVLSGYKWLFFLVVPVLFLSAKPAYDHPLHISVVEVNHNAAEKSLEISYKIFTDDFEKILAKNYRTKTDLINPPDRPAMDSLVKKYIFSHFSISNNGIPVKLSYLGFEHESEAVYVYVEGLNVASVGKIDLSMNIMYDLFDDQMNIIHIITKGKRESRKLDYPVSSAVISF